MQKPSLCIALSLALIAGCSGTLPNGMSHYEATRAEAARRVSIEAAPPDRYGIVFASVGTQLEKPFSSAWVNVRPRGQGGTSVFNDMNSRPHFDRANLWYQGGDLWKFSQGRTSVALANFSTGAEKGTLIASALPAGEYEVYTFYWMWNDYGATTKYYFSLPFTVKAGEAVYLGRFTARLTRLTTVHGVFSEKEVPDKAYFQVTSELDADGRLLALNGGLPAGFRLADRSRMMCKPEVYVRCEKEEATPSN